MQIDSSEEELCYAVSELLAAELLSEPHGAVALSAVHRFLAYNQEWAGQVELIREWPGMNLDWAGQVGTRRGLAR